MAHKDPEARRVYTKAYYEANKEKIAAKRRDHFKANRETILVRMREYYEVNKEELISKSQERYKADKEYIKARARIRGRLYAVNNIGAATDVYIKAQLRRMGFPVQYITQEILDAKRFNLLIKRELRKETHK
jgi:translation initiation factor IF-3